MVWAVSLSTMELLPHRLTPGVWDLEFGVWMGSERVGTPSPSSGSTPVSEPPRLRVNAFRGEPAISGFVWHFTPTHGSSEPFAPDTGSGLHSAFAELHPGHG